MCVCWCLYLLRLAAVAQANESKARAGLAPPCPQCASSPLRFISSVWPLHCDKMMPLQSLRFLASHTCTAQLLAFNYLLSLALGCACMSISLIIGNRRVDVYDSSQSRVDLAYNTGPAAACLSCPALRCLPVNDRAVEAFQQRPLSSSSSLRACPGTTSDHRSLLQPSRHKEDGEKHPDELPNSSCRTPLARRQLDSRPAIKQPGMFKCGLFRGGSLPW